MRHFAVPLIAAALLCLSPASQAKEEVQSVFYDKDEKELTSSELVKLLNKKLGGVYGDDPELTRFSPATWMLMGLGLAALPLVRRRRA